jgi:hypothetical protein
VTARQPARPAAPRVSSSLRAAGSDFFFNSWRLVPANLVWTALLIAILALAAFATAFALVLLPLLAVPLVGIYRMAALIARGQAVALSDAFGAYRRFGVPALLLGYALVSLSVMFGGNVVIGLDRADVAGWALATLAGWGLAITAMAACTTWPLLVDPAREDRPTRARLRLALLLIVAFPARFFGVALVLGLLLGASTVAFAVLMTVGVSFTALVATRYVLPAADRFEARG